jgi:hypothetical protein
VFETVCMTDIINFINQLMQERNLQLAIVKARR